jgi:ribonuclease T1
MIALRRPIAFAFLIACAMLALLSFAALARESLGAIAARDLPVEARTTLDRIRASGPFPYERDGVTFGNREALLPAKPRGYYHEYTVPTPGSKNRGARRIVCGGNPTSVAECYYSGDHYRTFRKIQP